MSDESKVQQNSTSQRVGMLQRYAAGMLGNLGDSQNIEPLIEALYAEDRNVQTHAARSLVNIGQFAVPALIDALKAESREVWMLAAGALVKIGHVAVPALLQALQEDEEAVRILVSEILGQIGDAQAVNGLVELLRLDNPNVRAASAVALVRIGEPAVSPLLNLLVDFGDAKVRRYGLEILKQMKQAALRPLLDMLENGSELERSQAAWVLGEVGETAIPSLLPLLKFPNEYVRYAGVIALGNMRNSATVPALTACLSDTARSMITGLRVCDVAARALERIDTPEAKTALEGRVKKS